MSEVARLILDTARRGELHHAIILHGPHEDEMRRLARDVAKAMNCLDGTVGDDCRSCQKIDREVHPDVHMVAVGEDRKLISIEQIRSMIAEAALRPYEGRTKVFIVETADAMSPSGANALLKTLEEPAGDTVFILISRSADRLLPTIRSRSQSIAIHHTTRQPVGELARSLGISAQEARIRAASASDDEGTVVSATVEQVTALLAQYSRTREAAILLEIATRLASVEDARIAVTAWVTLLRDLVSAPAAEAMVPDDFEEARRAAPAPVLLHSARIALRNLERLSVNTDLRLMVEQSVVQLSGAEPGAVRK